ncbi:hypothetical protein HHI36_008864, partial [Cryptolaemus montrouzieri]
KRKEHITAGKAFCARMERPEGQPTKNCEEEKIRIKTYLERSNELSSATLCMEIDIRVGFTSLELFSFNDHHPLNVSLYMKKEFCIDDNRIGLCN